MKPSNGTSDSKMNKHLSITVKGRVQGVFFRASTVEQAQELGVHGYVRNESNGDVHIEVEGEELIVQKFLEWTRIGPPRARVDECIVNEGEVKNYSGFKIQR